MFAKACVFQFIKYADPACWGGARLVQSLCQEKVPNFFVCVNFMRGRVMECLIFLSSPLLMATEWKIASESGVRTSWNSIFGETQEGMGTLAKCPIPLPPPPEVKGSYSSVQSALILSQSVRFQAV